MVRTSHLWSFQLVYVFLFQVENGVPRTDKDAAVHHFREAGPDLNTAPTHIKVIFNLYKYTYNIGKTWKPKNNTGRLGVMTLYEHQTFRYPSFCHLNSQPLGQSGWEKPKWKMAWNWSNYNFKFIFNEWSKIGCSHLTLENRNVSHLETFWGYDVYTYILHIFY